VILFEHPLDIVDAGTFKVSVCSAVLNFKNACEDPSVEWAHLVATQVQRAQTLGLRGSLSDAQNGREG